MERKVFKDIAIISLAVLCIVSYLFGFEPSNSLVKADYLIDNFSFSEYMAVSTLENGNNPFVWIVTAVAYPGAKVGRLVHNWVLNTI